MPEDRVNWLTRADAAKRLGVSEEDIDRLVTAELLTAGADNADAIDLRSIENYQRGPAGSATLVRFEQPLEISTRAARTPAIPAAAGLEPSVVALLQSLVAAATSNQTVPPERRIFLTFAEAVELSGLPARYLKRLIRGGAIKAIRAGAQWRIPRTELESLAGKLTEQSSEPSQLSEAEERDLEMNRLRRQGLLDPIDGNHEVN